MVVVVGQDDGLGDGGRCERPEIDRDSVSVELVTVDEEHSACAVFYHSTATAITSEGNRKPEKADRGGSDRRGREDNFTGQSCPDRQRNSAGLHSPAGCSTRSIRGRTSISPRRWPSYQVRTRFRVSPTVRMTYWTAYSPGPGPMRRLWAPNCEAAPPARKRSPGGAIRRDADQSAPRTLTGPAAGILLCHEPNGEYCVAVSRHWAGRSVRGRALRTGAARGSRWRRCGSLPHGFGRSRWAPAAHPQRRAHLRDGRRSRHFLVSVGTASVPAPR